MLLFLILVLVATYLNLSSFVVKRFESQKNIIEELTEALDTQNEQITQLHEKLKTQEYTTDYVLTDTERELIERVVAAEARGDTLEGIIAVAQVIKNRGDLWAMSYVDVVEARGQFAKPYQGEINDYVKLAVLMVFDYGVIVCDKPITHFHNNYVSPTWAQEKECYGKIGAHYFYY